MEENNIIDKKENKRSSKFYFLIGMAVASVVLACVFIAYIIQKNIAENKLKLEQEIAAQNRAGIVADSLREVNAQKTLYYNMIRHMANVDSIKKSQRYKKGDIVYLKPDSTLAVVYDIVVDSSFYEYTYILLLNNNFGIPNMSERKDKLIF